MRIAQITDTHIVTQSTHWLSIPATKTCERLAHTLAYLQQLSPAPDLLLVTGDLIDGGNKEAYEHLKEHLRTLTIPYYVIPGNHDLREEMRHAFAHQKYLPQDGFLQYTIEGYPLRLIALDTHVPGQDYGELCEERCAWLAKTLQEKPGAPTLIFMHHPPSKTGTLLFDNLRCFAHPHFAHLIHTSNHVIGCLAGHYHLFCMTSFAHKPCFIAPSVAPTLHIALPQDHMPTSLELDDPAISLHDWSEEGLISHVIRVKDNYHRIPWDKIIQAHGDRSKPGS